MLILKKFTPATANMFLNQSKYASKDARMGELGRTPVDRTPVYNRVWSMAVTYWLRMAQGTENVLLNDAFACAKIDNHPWLKDIRHLLYKNGFGYAWENPRSVHPKRFSRLVLNRLDDQAVQM